MMNTCQKLINKMVRYIFSLAASLPLFKRTLCGLSHSYVYKVFENRKSIETFVIYYN